MMEFWKVMLLDIAIIAASYFVFRYSLRGEWRHRVWEKYIDSFSIFIIIVFAVTIAINVLSYLILFYLGIKRYVYIVAPSAASVLVGFITASIPQRGVEDSGEKRQ